MSNVTRSLFYNSQFVIVPEQQKKKQNLRKSMNNNEKIQGHILMILNISSNKKYCILRTNLRKNYRRQFLPQLAIQLWSHKRTHLKQLS